MLKYKNENRKQIYLNESLRKRLENAAEQTGISASSIVKASLLKHLPNLERDINKKPVSA